MKMEQIVLDQINNVVYVIAAVTTTVAVYTTYIWRKAKKAGIDEVADESVLNQLKELSKSIKKLCNRFDEETRDSAKVHAEISTTVGKIQSNVAKLQGEMSILKNLIMKGQKHD